MDAGRKKGISINRRKRRFIQFESHTRLLALIITLSVGYLGPWDLGAVVVVDQWVGTWSLVVVVQWVGPSWDLGPVVVLVQWVGASRIAAGSRIGELDKEGDVGAELAPSRVE